MIIAAALGACGRIGFDGPAPDASGGDVRGADSNESLCATSSALICDGFVLSTLDGRWTPDTTSGAIGIDGVRAYRGASSLHASTNAISALTNNPHASIVTYDGLGAITGLVYARVWIFVPVGFPTTEFAQVLNFADDAGLGISLGTRDGFIANNDYTSNMYKLSTTVQLPMGRWACLQMEMPSNSTATARLFLDGAEITDVAITRTSAQPPPTHVYTGLTWIGDIPSLPAGEVWIDEIVIDTSPTSCAQ